MGGPGPALPCSDQAVPPPHPGAVRVQAWVYIVNLKNMRAGYFTSKMGIFGNIYVHGVAVRTYGFAVPCVS